MNPCPDCEKAGDAFCVNINGVRVASMDGQGHVTVHDADPKLVAAAQETVQEAVDRLGLAVAEGLQRIGLYSHLRDTLALAGRKGASA